MNTAKQAKKQVMWQLSKDTPSIRSILDRAQGMELHEKIQYFNKLVTSGSIPRPWYVFAVGWTTSKVIEQTRDADPLICDLNDKVEKIERQIKKMRKLLKSPLDDEWNRRAREIGREILAKCVAPVDSELANLYLSNHEEFFRQSEPGRVEFVAENEGRSKGGAS
jgi:hypothetical protein